MPQTCLCAHFDGKYQTVTVLQGLKFNMFVAKIASFHRER